MLSALEVLLRERSVSRAADHVGLSQPAMSNALARMRTAFGDSLVIRGRKGLVLTERGQLLLRQLSDLLPHVEVLARPSTFSPADTDATFMLATTDHAGTVLLPEVLRLFSAEAPNAILKTTTVLSRHLDMDRLESSGYDLRVGWFDSFPPHWHARVLFTDDLVVVGRADDARIVEPMPLDSFLAAKHVVLAPAQGSTRNLADDLLARSGLRRNVGAFASSFAAMPFIVGATDMIAAMPRRIAERYSHLPNIKTVESPFAFEKFAVSMAWHPRIHHDGAYEWLRGIIIAAAEQ